MPRPAPRIEPAPLRRRAPSPVVPLIVVLVVLVGGIIFLSRSAHEQPMRTIEVDVANAATPR